MCNWLARTVKDKSFAFAGISESGIEQCGRLLIARGGGIVQDGVTPQLNYLISGKSRGISALEKQAGMLNEKGASIQLLNERSFASLLMPTREDSEEVLTGDEEVAALWMMLVQIHWFRTTFLIDLSNANLAKAIFRPGLLSGVNLDGANLAGATARQVHFEFPSKLRRVSFVGANLKGCMIKGAEHCDFANADLSGASLYDLCACNFSGANLQGLLHINKVDSCNFEGANFSGSPIYFSESLNNSNLVGAVFSGCSLQRLKVGGARLTGAIFANADLLDANFERSDLSRANLLNAKFCRARLAGANLSGANCKGVDFSGADLTGATVDGADFTGAILSAAKLENVDIFRAIGLKIAEPAGAKVLEFERLVAQHHIDSTSVTMTMDKKQYLLKVGTTHFQWERLVKWGRSEEQFYCDTSSLSEAMVALACRWPNASLRADSISVSRSTDSQLLEAALLAWFEAFGLTCPSAAEMDRALCAQEIFRHRVIMEELKGGTDGIESWNARPMPERDRVGSLSNADFSNTVMPKADLRRLDLSGANFSQCAMEECSLIEANLHAATFCNTRLDRANVSSARAEKSDFSNAILAGADLGNAVFSRAKLRQSDLANCNLSNADLHDADLEQANLSGANLMRADVHKSKFRGADLSNANMCEADLRGADFYDCKMTNTTVTGAKYDEKTIFPDGFRPGLDMRWSSKLPNPAIAANQGQPAAPVSFEGLMTGLRQNVKPDKLSKALTMLKRDRFKLFAEFHGDGLTGVVRSQSDNELIYSCRLGADGVFACCTQNLKPCGGLKGSLCKHLLVLVIGLTKAEQLKAEVAGLWVINSLQQAALLDKDTMSTIFLKYKGAEAGEVDWRPTETIPEDYYMF